MKSRLWWFALLLLFATMASALDCKQPLDQDTLNRVGLGFGPDVQLKPGQSHQFALAILSTFAPSEPVAACATWKVEPEGKGANITTEGLLNIDANTPPGSRFVVTADIEKRRTQRQMPIMVYTDKTHPLVGVWKQTQFQCQAGGDIPTPATGTIQELEFRASGWFSVTWTPFETYRDYWGNYTADPVKKDLSLKIERGNYLPANFRGTGTFTLTKPDTVELQGVFLGVRHDGSATEEARVPAACSYTFVRSSQPG